MNKDIKEQLEEVIKRNLPEKDIPRLGSENQHDYIMYSNGFNQALSQIDIELIADEVLNVVVEKIMEDKYHYWRECHNCGYSGNHYLHCLHDGVQSKCIKCNEILPSIIGDCDCDFVITENELLSNLSPNKENKK